MSKLKLFLIGISVWAIAGCDSHTKEGALIGGVGGAAVGAAVGSKSHSRAGEGAVIGGAAGALGGAAIGGQMDKNEKESQDANNRPPQNGKGYYDSQGYWHEQ